MFRFTYLCCKRQGKTFHHKTKEVKFHNEIAQTFLIKSIPDWASNNTALCKLKKRFLLVEAQKTFEIGLMIPLWHGIKWKKKFFCFHYEEKYSIFNGQAIWCCFERLRCWRHFSPFQTRCTKMRKVSRRIPRSAKLLLKCIKSTKNMWVTLYLSM